VFGLMIGAGLMRAWPSAREAIGAVLVVAGASITIFGRQAVCSLAHGTSSRRPD
jgi:hypothetical protein